MAAAHDARTSGDPDARLQAARGRLSGGRSSGTARISDEEFLAFLDHVAERGAEGIDPGTPVHVILDNVSSHRSAEVREWLKGHPDWTFHFTPTSASHMSAVMNAVEGFFSKLARQRLKNAVFNSLDACVAAIGGCIGHRNARDARPFRWNRGPEDLVESWRRGHRRLRDMESNE